MGWKQTLRKLTMILYSRCMAYRKCMVKDTTSHPSILLCTVVDHSEDFTSELVSLLELATSLKFILLYMLSSHPCLQLPWKPHLGSQLWWTVTWLGILESLASLEYKHQETQFKLCCHYLFSDLNTPWSQEPCLFYFLPSTKGPEIVLKAQELFFKYL